MSAAVAYERKDRHSGVSKSPRKNGAGKGNWGKAGEEAEAYIPASDAYGDIVDIKAVGDVSLRKTPGIIMESKQVSNPNADVVRDYLRSGDLEDFSSNLVERKSYLQYEKVVYEAISISMDYGGYERELVSRMLAELSGGLLSRGNIEVGFELVLAELKDMAIDLPGVDQIMGKFIARAVVDEVLAPAFYHLGKQPTLKAKDAVGYARGLTNAPHAAKRLAKVWGPLESVGKLRRATRAMATEYVANEDLAEAVETMRSLKAHAFHGHMVEELILCGLDKLSKSSSEIIDLLAGLVKANALSRDSVSEGFSFVERSLSDIKLDVPQAESGLSSLRQQAEKRGIIA